MQIRMLILIIINVSIIVTLHERIQNLTFKPLPCQKNLYGFHISEFKSFSYYLIIGIYSFLIKMLLFQIPYLKVYSCMLFFSFLKDFWYAIFFCKEEFTY